eukprot:322391-Pleurochrysis_carterae.AAC.1
MTRSSVIIGTPQDRGWGDWGGGKHLQDLQDVRPEPNVKNVVLDDVVTNFADIDVIVVVVVVVVAAATRVAEFLLGVGGRNHDLAQVVAQAQQTSKFAIAPGEARVLGAVQADPLAV